MDAIGFFNRMIITGYDWLVIHLKVMAIVFIYYFVQPLGVIGCVLCTTVRCVTICRFGLYANFYKSIVLGLFFFLTVYMQGYVVCHNNQILIILIKKSAVRMGEKKNGENKEKTWNTKV